MDTYNILKNDLSRINSDVAKLLAAVNSIPGVSSESVEDWQKTCHRIETQLSQDMVRIAVVGTIKSGKSTFVNSLFQGDFLKRGAGVVTSIVTKIRKSDRLNATLQFKSWDEINSEIQRALILFPNTSWQNNGQRFDIRREEDREDLRSALITLDAEQLVTNDTRNVNSVLLMSYLDGYDDIKEIIMDESTRKCYADELFSRHRNFAGNEILAVFLKDIQLEINTGSIDRHIEIADCQGSDSPNPLHLAMIQNYLSLTHLIIYVVSSRTGLRRADFKFLSMIKQMGIIDNILFVVNCDFSEHDHIDELNRLINKITSEIGLIKPDAEIYSFSSLYNLFKACKDELPEKDFSRLKQWSNEKGITSLSDRQYEEFFQNLNTKITEERYSLLLKNHFGRLGIITSGVYHLINIHKDILTNKTGGVTNILKSIDQHQKKMNQLKEMIKSTLDGTGQKMKRKLRGDVDRFFDARSGEIVCDVMDFIKEYKISVESYSANLSSAGFSNTMYLVYQEFKQALDFYMAETITPRIIGFLKEEENQIIEQLEQIAKSYDTMVYDALAEYVDALSDFGVALEKFPFERMKLPDVDAIKLSGGLSLPPAVLFINYSAKIKVEAVMRLGVYSVVNKLKRALRKGTEVRRTDKQKVLKYGIRNIKRDTVKSIHFHMKSYRENIKFQYIFKLVDEVSQTMNEILIDRLKVYVTDLSNIKQLVGQNQADKEKILAILDQLDMEYETVHKKMLEFERRIVARSD